MTNTSSVSQLEISSLDNPLYYLENFKTVVNWVVSHHSDMLIAEELEALTVFKGLATGPQALLVRLIMRRGALFRLSKLSYPELEVSLQEAVIMLVDAGWLRDQPQISIDQLFRLFTRIELVHLFSEELARMGSHRSATKKQMLESLLEAAPEPRTLSEWSPHNEDRIVELQSTDLIDRIRLMFFGNLHQSWTEFVLTELGHQRYEQVMFSPQSRAFKTRNEVDDYLQLQYFRECLDEGESPSGILNQVPASPNLNRWLEARRNRLLFSVGRAAERRGELALAISAYARSTYPDALIRQLRVMERCGSYDQAYPLACESLKMPQTALQQQSLERIVKRVSKKLDLPAPKVVLQPAIPCFEIGLLQTEDSSVEQAAASWLAEPDAPVYYVENTLLNGLFALLCWPVLFAPLEGAFFHPFHAGPADLVREGFVERRHSLFEDCLALLESGDYRREILQTYSSKQGISCTFIRWPMFGQEVVETALECIPAIHLSLYFRRILADIKNNRAGLPDLIQFWPDQKRYRLIEVKGPGDNLQDNQRRWFYFCLQRNLPIALCKVKWV